MTWSRCDRWCSNWVLAQSNLQGVSTCQSHQMPEILRRDSRRGICCSLNLRILSSGLRATDLDHGQPVAIGPLGWGLVTPVRWSVTIHGL
jgi:hypothetical protein